MEDIYFVQVAYQRGAFPEAPKPNPPPVDPPAAEGAVAEPEKSDQPAIHRPAKPKEESKSEEQRPNFRVLTPEEREKELAEMRARDNTRVRALFDLIDKANEGKELPDGARVVQGDIVAPGLNITKNPFPDWFDAALQQQGFEFDTGCIAYTKRVTEAVVDNKRIQAKTMAEGWYWWVMQILANEKEKADREQRPPLVATTVVSIREDHQALLQDLIS
jgi:hypothetical protein